MLQIKKHNWLYESKTSYKLNHEIKNYYDYGCMIVKRTN